METVTFLGCSGDTEWGRFLLASRVARLQTSSGRSNEWALVGRADGSKGAVTLHRTISIRMLRARARLLTDGPMFDLNSFHWEATRVPGSQHCACGMCRCSDQTIRLRQRNAKRGKLPPPLAGLSALRLPDRQDTETVE